MAADRRSSRCRRERRLPRLSLPLIATATSGPFPTCLNYRLKMIDLDGTYTYSNIRSVVSRAATERDLAVYPNPASDQVSLLTSGTVSDVLLRDISGRLLRKVSSCEKEKGIPVSGLNPGGGSGRSQVCRRHGKGRQGSGREVGFSWMQPTI